MELETGLGNMTILYIRVNRKLQTCLCLETKRFDLTALNISLCVSNLFPFNARF